MKRILVDRKTGKVKVIESYDDPTDDIARKKFAQLLAEYIIENNIISKG